VLVINGEKDVQVRADVDAVRLFDALKSRSGSKQELFIVPGASHNFKKVKDDADPAFEGPVVPTMLDKLTSWLKANLV
jgi:dipeptidyl aminopeptidase/acylaminoacyl peptidase